MSGLVCVMTLVAFAAADAAPAYRFDLWNTDNGLPQNSVNAILQTEDGYLWLTTADGLVRFDGIRFTVFDRASTPGIRSNRLTALFEDRSGTLWIGSENAGAIRYRDGTFTSLTSRDGLLDDRVIGFQESDDGMVHILTGNGMARWMNGRILPAAAYEPALRPRPGSEFLKELWYADGATVHRFSRGRRMEHRPQVGQSGLDIVSVHEDQRGVVWVADRATGLLRIDGDRTRIIGTRDGLPHDVRTARVCEDRHGALWMASPRGGIIRVAAGASAQYGAAEGFTDDAIRTLYSDREGSVWVGTWTSGLYRVRETPIRMYTEADGLGNRNVYPMVEDREGNVWVGAEGVLARFRDGRFSRHPVPGRTVTALHADREGRLWVGADDVLLEMKANAGLETVYADPRLLRFQQIRAIHRDRSGALWFGTNGGLRRYDQGAITLYTPHDGLAGEDVRVIHEDRSGRLWIGTYGGLSRLEDGRFWNVTEADGLSSNQIRAIHEDDRGVLWIGTYDGGLNRLEGEQLTHVTASDGLFNNGVFQILDDGRGRFWMCSNRGIYRVNKSDLEAFSEGRIRSITSLAYGKDDGLLTTECNGGRQPAGVRRRDGTLWFPTPAGVAVIDPAAAPVQGSVPRVSIESGLLQRQPIDVRSAVSIMPGQSDLEIVYSAPTFLNPKEVRFRYQMEGLEREWVEAGTRRTAYYSHLAPGRYTFRVVAGNGDGQWSADEATLSVTVIPPFWQTWWFSMVAALAVAAAGAVVYEARIRRLRWAHAARVAFARQLIESQEAERRRIAGELHDSLGQNLLIIRNRALLGLQAADTASPSREHLDDIAASASRAIEEVRQIAYDLRPFHLDRLGLTSSIEAMIERAADAAHIISTLDIAALDGCFSKDAEIHVYRILQEILNNVLKHSGATRIAITARADGGTLHVSVDDNGRGFLADGRATPGTPREGIGLDGIAERVRILGGSHTVRSVPGHGTTISFTLPVESGKGEP